MRLRRSTPSRLVQVYASHCSGTIDRIRYIKLQSSRSSAFTMSLVPCPVIKFKVQCIPNNKHQSEFWISSFLFFFSAISYLTFTSHFFRKCPEDEQGRLNLSPNHTTFCRVIGSYAYVHTYINFILTRNYRGYRLANISEQNKNKIY